MKTLVIGNSPSVPADNTTTVDSIDAALRLITTTDFDVIILNTRTNSGMALLGGWNKGCKPSAKAWLDDNAKMITL